MARVFRTEGDARSASRDLDLLVASTDGIYKVSDRKINKIKEGSGEAVDINGENVAYALGGTVYYNSHEIPFGSRVLDLSISNEGHLAIAGKRNEFVLWLDGEIRRFATKNRTTGVDWLDEYVVVTTRDGKTLIYDTEGNLIDRILVSRPFTAVTICGEDIYVGVSDGGIYKFRLYGEIDYVGEHVRWVSGLDCINGGIVSVGEDRQAKIRISGLKRERKFHFDTYDVAAYMSFIAVVGPRYIWIGEISV